MRTVFLLAGIAIPCLPPAARPAAAALPGDAIVVTATRSPQPLADVAASVSVVTARQIAETPARGIDDVLRRVPSVDLPFASTNEQHPTDTIVSMRGLSGIRALVLLDGVPLNDPFFGYVQWSAVPLDTIDRVEVVRGGGAPLWGNYAMGGVINILTRPVDRTGLMAEAAGGSRGSYRIDGHGAVAGTGYGVGFDGGVTGTDGYVEQVKGYRGPVVVPTSSRTRTAALSGRLAIAPALTVRARIARYANDQDFLTRVQTNRQRNWRGTATLGWMPGSRDTIDLTLFAQDGRFVTNNPGAPDGVDPTQAEFVQNRHRTRVRDRGASLIWTRRFDGVLRSLTVGGDDHAIRRRDDAAILDETGARLRTDVGAGRQRFLGAFAQAEARPVDALQLLASVRYQAFRSYRGRDDTPGGLGADVPARSDHDVDPRLSARLRLPAGFALRAAAYRAFRAPTLDNLYRSASVPGYILYANAALRPERLKGAEAGFDYDRGTVRFQATVYASRITGLITYRYLPADALPPGFDIGARLINAGRARSRGVEAALTWKPSPAWEAVLGYTFADSVVTRNPADPASVGVQQPGIPRHRATALVTWTGPRGLRVSPSVRWAGRTNGDPDAIYRTQAHIVADLAASLPVTRGLEAFVQVENLFDARYVGTNDGFTAPLYGKPLTALAGFRVRLGDRAGTS